MRHWREFLNDRGDELAPDEPEGRLWNVVRLAFQRHRPEFERFLSSLADRDGRLKDELEDLRAKKNVGVRGFETEHPADEVVPAAADTAGGLEPAD